MQTQYLKLQISSFLPVVPTKSTQNQYAGDPQLQLSILTEALSSLLLRYLPLFLYNTEYASSLAFTYMIPKKAMNNSSVPIHDH